MDETKPMTYTITNPILDNLTLILDLILECVCKLTPVHSDVNKFVIS